MNKTTNYNLKKPEKNEYVNIDDINENMDTIDAELKKKVNADGGDISNTVVSTADEIKTEYPVPEAGDSPKTLLGKIKKFCSDIKSWMSGVCLLGQIVNNCVTNNAGLPLSAAQGKVLMDKYTQLYSDMKKKISIGGEIISSYVTYYEQDGRYATINFEIPSGANQLILEKDTAAVTILRNSKWTEQYRFATTSMLSDYVPKSDLVVSSSDLQSKQNITDSSNIKFYKYGKIVVAHISITTTSSISGYNILKLGVIPTGLRPLYECRCPLVKQQSNESRIVAFTTNGDINLWNWSSTSSITTPSESSFCGYAVYCVG